MRALARTVLPFLSVCVQQCLEPVVRGTGEAVAEI